MKFSIIFLLARLSMSSAADAEVKKDDHGVLILKEDNFQKYIDEHENVLVSFCEPKK